MARKVEIDVRILIFAVALIIITSVGSAFAAYLMITKNIPGVTTEPGVYVHKREIGPTYELGNFIVNLSSPNGLQSRFVRTEIVLELDNSKNLEAEIQRREPQIRDRIISILRSRSIDQLSSPDSLNTLKLDIVTQINNMLISGTVMDAYFVDLVIQ